MTTYKTRTITPSQSTDGEYVCDVPSQEDYDINDLLAEWTDGGCQVFEIGKDILPESIKDIRGRVHYEPARIFAVLGPDADQLAYIGLDQVDANGEMNTYTIDGITITLTQNAYVGDDGTTYLASAEDSDGNIYRVTWETLDSECEDQSNACDWSHPVSLELIETD